MDPRLDSFADRLTLVSKVDLEAILKSALEAYQTLNAGQSFLLSNSKVYLLPGATTGRKGQFQVTLIPAAADLESFNIEDFTSKYIHTAMRRLWEQVPNGPWDYVALETPIGMTTATAAGQINLRTGGAASMRVVLHHAPIDDESEAPPNTVYTNPHFYNIENDTIEERRVALVLRFDIRIIPRNLDPLAYRS